MLSVGVVQGNIKLEARLLKENGQPLKAPWRGNMARTSNIRSILIPPELFLLNRTYYYQKGFGVFVWSRRGEKKPGR